MENNEQTHPSSILDQIRRAEAERVAQLADLDVNVVLRHLIDLEREGIIELVEVKHG